ncbi:MAG: radical SAM protein, partial [Bacilli bacterium]
NKFEKLMKIQNSPICKYCDAYQCNACKFLNKKLTEEYNIPSKIQCEISILERNKSKKLQSNLIMKGLIANKNIINDIDYLDPIENLIRIQENAR